MKKQETDDGGMGKEEKNKKNEKRLGGKGLSLQAFANIKSGPSGYNPSIIKKQREFYRNAKYISKFKKSIKREDQSEDHLPETRRLEDRNDNKNEVRQSMNKKKERKISLQSLREDFEKKQAEEEKTKIEREATIQAKKEERAKAEAKRKDQREKMLKKTRSGQPVMKYRIEHLLEGILKNSTN